MHTIAQIIQFLASPLVGMTNALAPLLAQAGERPLKGSDFTVASFAVSVAFVGILCVWWAAWIHARFSNYRAETRREASLLRGAIRFRDALLNAGEQAIVVLGAARRSPMNFARGGVLLQECMTGPDAVIMASALNALLKQGTSFAIQVRTSGFRKVSISGQPLGRNVAVFLKDIGAVEDVDYRTVLDDLPVPVWLRRSNLSLLWANRTFVDLVGARSLESALASNAMFDRSEQDLAVSARDGVEVRDVRRYVAVGNERRAISVNFTNLPDRNLLGSAVDVTDAAQAEAKLKSNAEAYADVLDRIPVAIADFGSDKRLSCHNSAFSQMWCLPQSWLDTRPTANEILDRLRDAGRLPEQRDFQSWKREQLKTFEDVHRYVDDTWHMPGGKSIRVQAQPDLDGGVCFLFEDISEIISLSSKLTLLTDVQRATLDTVEDGIAVFGPDGKLAVNNRVFARMWALSDEDVLSSPHFSRLASLCISRRGHDTVWDIISAGISSSEPERYGAWGKVTRTDGKIISVSFTRLPNGATVVTLKDLTDIERFSEALNEKPYAAA